MAAELGLYVAHLTLGYLLMLVVMVYQVELFTAVVLGLAVGHALFNLGGDVQAPDPCCQHELAAAAGAPVGGRGLDAAPLATPSAASSCGAKV